MFFIEHRQITGYAWNLVQSALHCRVTLFYLELLKTNASIALMQLGYDFFIVYFALLRIALRGKVDLFWNGPWSVEVDAIMHNSVIMQHHNSKVS